MLMRVLGANNPRMIYSGNYGNKMNTVFLTKMELKDGLCRPLRLTNRPTFPGLTRFSTYCVVVDGGNFRVLLPTPPKLIIATYSTEVDYGIPWSSIYGTFTVERFYPKPEPSLLVRTTSLRQSFSSVLLYNTRIHFSWDGNQRWLLLIDLDVSTQKPAWFRRLSKGSSISCKTEASVRRIYINQERLSRFYDPECWSFWWFRRLMTRVWGAFRRLRSKRLLRISTGMKLGLVKGGA